MRSEEEIKESWSVINKGLVRAHFPEEMKVLKDAITELLTLRRRLADREGLAKSIRPAMYSNVSSEVADAIIKYLTEGKDGE